MRYRVLHVLKSSSVEIQIWISQEVVVERGTVERQVVESEMTPDGNRVFVVIQHYIEGGVCSSVVRYKVKRNRDVISSR